MWIIKKLAAFVRPPYPPSVFFLILGIMDRMFRVGDKVKIIVNSRFYCNDESCNPRDTVGVITDIGIGNTPALESLRDDLYISVSWDKSYVVETVPITNVYHHTDLEHVDIVLETFGRLNNFKFE